MYTHIDPAVGQFRATSLSTGRELEQISAFLDQLETGAEHVLSEARVLRRRMLALNDASEDRIYELRVALEQLLVQLGGPSGSALSGVIDQYGQPVTFTAQSPATGPGWADSNRSQPTGAAPPNSPPPTTPPVASTPPQSQPVMSDQLRTPPASAPVIGGPGQPLSMPPPTGARVA